MMEMSKRGRVVEPKGQLSSSPLPSCGPEAALLLSEHAFLESCMVSTPCLSPGLGVQSQVMMSFGTPGKDRRGWRCEGGRGQAGERSRPGDHCTARVIPLSL